jgi:hypothetical protein
MAERDRSTVGDPATPPADGWADCVNDESFTHYFNLT